MKIEAITRDIQRSDSFQERSMGLAVGSEAFVFNVLRKDLYSDPIGSLIREYTVNAQDEHRKHGKTNVPIHIQVPNNFSPELHIRDFAGGLTEEQVFDFFGNYGASDKRDSNVAVGFFGLGCKSAFAYTDSYIVKSYKDGVCYTFNIYIDETEIGKTAKIAEEETIEPNGIQIIVPVKTYDIAEFQRKVIKTVSYFKVKPTITGMAEAPVFDVARPIIKGDDWGYFGSGSPTVVMGEIPYPLDSYKMGDNLESWERSLLRSNIVLYVNIGDVQVTASREALQMSPKTVEKIREKLKAIKDAMLAETEKTFKDAKNLIEAKQLYNSVVQVGGGYSEIIRDSGIAIKWNGEEITDNVIRFQLANNPSVATVSHYSFTYKGNVRSFVENRLICKKDFTIYFDDTDQKKVGYGRRMRTLSAEGKKNILVVHTSDVKELEKVLGMKVSELPSLKAVKETMPPSRAGYGTGIDGSKLVKHKAKVFVLNVAKVKKGVYGSASEYWDLQEIDNPKGVYISIDRFQPVSIAGIHSLASLQTLLMTLDNAGITLNVPIYGIKKGGSTEGLVRIDKWLDFKIANQKELLENISVAEGFTFARYNVLDVSTLEVSALPNNSVAKKFAMNYKKAKQTHTDISRKAISGLFNYTSVKVTRDETLKELNSQFVEKYPLLSFVSNGSFYRKEVTDYIRQQDLTR